MLRNGRLVHRRVLVRPEVLEGIVGHALPLRLAYHPGQRVHYRVILQRLEDVEIAASKLWFLCGVRIRGTNFSAGAFSRRAHGPSVVHVPNGFATW
jgi:hypothetical protein